METIKLTESFSLLLKDFEKILPERQQRLPTYLEIIGKAHKEDAISNLLAFFFDPSQPHGLGSLFYCTFMKCIGISESVSAVNIIAVNREITTAQGKRIDLLIETSDSILAIENKIHHWLHNDLDEYANHIRRLDKKKRCHLAVLSLYAQGPAIGDVPNVIYSSFIQALKIAMEESNAKITSEYAPFLADFFTTIQNLKTQNMLDESLRQFLISNETAIDKLLAEKKRFDDTIYSRAQTLMGLFENRPNVKKDIWQKFVVMNQKIYPNGLYLKVDCTIGYKGYWFHVFVQRHGTDNSTADVLDSIPYFKDATDWNVWLNEDAMPFDTPLQEVADKMNEILRIVFP